MLETVLMISAALGVTATPLLMSLTTRGVVRSVDDAGIRCSIGGTHLYLSFVAIASASADRNFAGDPRLVVRMREGKQRVRRLRTEGQAPAVVLEAVLHGLSRASTQEAAASTQPLAALFAAIDARHAGGEGYRGMALDSARLSAVFTDRGAPSLARALAAYELLAHGSPQDGAVVVSACNAALPPIVVAALARVPGTQRLLREVVTEASPYLAPDERTAMIHHLSTCGPASPTSQARIEAAIDAAAA